MNRRCPSFGAAPPKRRMGIENREQRQANSRLRGSRGDPLRHLGNIGVSAAIYIVVEIMELADPRKAGLQHFHVELAGNGLGMVRRHRQGETVHDISPAPEAVCAGTPHFGETCHAALESVAVQVRHTGTRISWRSSPCLCLNTRLDGSKPAIADRQPYILLPSRRRKSRFCMNAGQGLIPS